MLSNLLHARWIRRIVLFVPFLMVEDHFWFFLGRFVDVDWWLVVVGIILWALLLAWLTDR